MPGVKIFRYEGPVCFASFQDFLASLVRKTGLAPVHPFYLQAPFSSLTIESQTKNYNGSHAAENAPLLTSAEIAGSDITEDYGVFSHTCSIGPVLLREQELSPKRKSFENYDHLRIGAASHCLSKMNEHRDVQKADPREGIMPYKVHRRNYIVLDCACWSYMDATSTNSLKEVRSQRFFNK